MDWLSILPSIFGAGSSMLGNFNANANARMNAREARQWEEDMYNKYNSPSAMVRQYEEAGLNPALMYGNAPIAAPTDTSAAETMPPNTGTLTEMLGQMLQLQLFGEEYEGKKLENENKRLENEGKRIENAFKPSLLSQQLEKGSAEISNIRAGIEKMLHEIYNIDQQSLSEEYRRDLMTAQKQLAIAQSILAGKQGEYVDAQTFEQEWSNQVASETGNKPGTNVWSLLPGVAQKGGSYLNAGYRWLIDRVTSKETRERVASSGTD